MILGLLLATSDAAAQPTDAPTTRPTVEAQATAELTPSTPASQPATPAASPGGDEQASDTADDASRDPYREGLDTTGTASLPPPDNRLPPTSAPPGTTRPVPDYERRTPPGTTAGDVLIWVPRAIGYPVHLALEYLVRWPIVTGFTWLEEHYVIERTIRLFSFRDDKSLILPTAFIDFGLNPTVGFFNSNRDLLYKGQNLILQGGFWDGWVNLRLGADFPVFSDDSGMLRFAANFFTRPDQIFDELNPGSLPANSDGTRGAEEFFYRLRQFEVTTALRAALKDLNRVTLELAFRDAKISDSDAADGGDDTSVLERFDGDGDGVLDPALFPGFGERYQVFAAELKLELDTRSPDRVFTPGSGMRLELFGSFNIDPSESELRFFKWGAEAGIFLDVTGRNHVLAARGYVEFLERSGDAPVPVPEQIFLGGPEHMRGFLEGRSRGDSALVWTLDYRYPVWILMDANVFVSLGNTFKDHLESVHIKRMFLSWGFGLRTNTSRDVSFDLLVAFGTNRLDSETLAVDNVRFVFGVNQGF